MLTINFVFYLDFLVFAIFSSLLITEIMGAIILLAWWKRYRRTVLHYIVPVWEVTGTFGAFWVVLSDFAFPGVLIPLAGLYAGAIMIFLILFVARNSTIVFGEYIIKKGWLDERKLYAGYSVSTIFIGIVVLYVLSGVIGGVGISLATLQVNAFAWLYNPADIIFVVGALILIVGLAPVFYGAEEMKIASLIITPVGLAVSLVSLYMFQGSSLSYLVAIPVVLSLLPAVLFNMEEFSSLVRNKAFFIAWLSVDLFSLNFLVYPDAFGMSLPVDSLTTSGSMAVAYFDITLVGGILLAVLISLYALAAGRRARASGAGA